MIKPPATESELLRYADKIVGKTLKSLAASSNVSIPNGQKSAKGWIGELIEKNLGATAGPRPEPDFPALGIELKTLPLNRQHKPKESTFVCSVSLGGQENAWETSLVKRKLSRVLWIPVEADPSIPFPQRRIGNALLWSPSTADFKIIQSDWEELMDMINMGEISKITASIGKYLQIRPKGANAKSLRSGIDEDGILTPTLPRGFYLRTLFTRKILAEFENTPRSV